MSYLNTIPNLGSTIASASTITLDGSGAVYPVTGTTTIATIDSGPIQPGQCVTLWFESGLTLTHGSGLVLQGGVDAVLAANNTITLALTAANTWLEVARGAAPVSAGRTLLGANTSLYVSTTGNDSTGNGTSGAPWATLAHAVAVATQNYDCGNYTLTIQLADGTYTIGSTLNLGAYVASGSGGIVIQGDTSNFQSVVLEWTNTGAAISVTQNPLPWTIQYVQLENTAALEGSFINVNGYGRLILSDIYWGEIGSGTNAAQLINAVGIGAEYALVNAHTFNWPNSLAWTLLAQNGATMDVSAATITFTSAPNDQGMFGALWGSTLFAYGLAAVGSIPNSGTEGGNWARVVFGGWGYASSSGPLNGRTQAQAGGTWIVS